MMLYKRLREIDVPEMMASIIAQTPGKPWGYYRDMTRQLWDEARHAMMGEVGFVALGVDWTKARITWNWSLPAEHRVHADGAPRRAVLHRAGADAEDRQALRVGGRPASRGIPLTATIQDFDWADEVLHSQIGREWYVPGVRRPAGGAEVRRRCWTKILSNWTTVKEQGLTQHENWWPAIYSQACAAAGARAGSGGVGVRRDLRSEAGGFAGGGGGVIRYAIPLIVLAELFGTSLWFTGNAAVTELKAAWELSPAASAWLLNATQLGFIVGTLTLAATALADRYPAHRVFFWSAIVGAAANVGFAFLTDGFALALVFRFVTAFALAGIYPLGMKLVVRWAPERAGGPRLAGRGLVIGTASPFLFRHSASIWDWSVVRWRVVGARRARRGNGATARGRRGEESRPPVQWADAFGRSVIRRSRLRPRLLRPHVGTVRLLEFGAEVGRTTPSRRSR